jgi:peptidyl-prolyl cis-trans isomerase SurA
MKNLLLRLVVLTVVCTTFSGQLWGQKEIADKVIAIVGDEYILRSDIEEAYESAKAQRGTVPDNYRCLVLDNILTGKLLVNQAKIDSIYPKEEEVENQLNARIEQILAYMNGNVEQFVSYYGKSPDDVKVEMRDDLRDQIMSEKMRGKVVAEASVTPSEVKQFFAKIPKDSLPYFNQEVEISEIVYKPKVNEEQKNIARQQVEDLRKRIVDSKEDFATLAKKYSQDPGSGREGGDLGFAKRGKFVPEFEAAAYKLEKGEVSNVIETEFGFHVLQLIERRGNSVHVRHILIKPEITATDLVEAKHKLDSVRTELLHDSIRFSYAVKVFGDKSVQSYHNDGRLTNPQSGNNTFETRDLDPEIYFAIDTIKRIGGITQPIEFTTVTGEKGYRLVKLLSRTTPHKANLGQDYNKIQLATLEQKKAATISHWISEKVNATYVQIDKIYYGCPNLAKWRSKVKP